MLEDVELRVLISEGCRARCGEGRGLRFGTGIGAVLVLRSGGGRGVPGGGNGFPRPIGCVKSGISLPCSEAMESFVWSRLLCSAFNPHFRAFSAALATALRVFRLGVDPLLTLAPASEPSEFSSGPFASWLVELR